MIRAPSLFLTAALAAGLIIVPVSARAEDGRNRDAALGALGGLAAGAAIAGATRDRDYRDNRRQRIEAEREDDTQVCHFERRRVQNEYGDVEVRRIRVCE